MSRREETKQKYDRQNQIREEREREAQENQKKKEREWYESACEKFVDKRELADEIKHAVYPAIVEIELANGVKGTGFFQQANWLVSNAHVIRDRYELEDASIVADKNETTLSANRSFHRPDDATDTPDVVIIEIAHHLNQNNACLPTTFSENKDTGNQYYFYIDIHVENFRGCDGYEIKFLNFIPTEPGVYPSIYSCEDDHGPQVGSSGSPIIAARMIVGRESQWQFAVVGMLYARCAAWWVKEKYGIEIGDDKPLVCAIPIEQEFSQILDILRKEESAVRHHQSSDGHRHVYDEQGALSHQQQAERETQEAREAFRNFEKGDTPLKILLPAGLEKLYYGKRIVKIEESLLIEKVRKFILGNEAKNYKNVPSVEPEVLRHDFNALLEELKKEKTLTLKRTNEWYFSPKNYFRIDCSTTVRNSASWNLYLQDNTGKDDGKPYHAPDGQPLSSVFAVVKYPFQSEKDEIPGNLLAELLRKSQESSKEQYHTVSIELQQDTYSGQKEKRAWGLHVKAKTLTQLKDFQGAIHLYSEAIALQQEAVKEPTEALGIFFANLARCHAHLEEYDKAIEFFENSWDVRKEVLGDTHSKTLEVKALFERLKQKLQDLSTSRSATPT